MTDTHILKLSTPIQAHGETVSELTLRPPTVTELRRAGTPYRVVQGGVEWNYDAVAKLLVAICAIPAPSVDQMAASDFDDAAGVIVGFMKRAPTSEGAPGSTPQS